MRYRKTRLCLLIIFVFPLTTCKTSDRKKNTSTVLNTSDPSKRPAQAAFEGDEFVIPKSKFSTKTTNSMVTRRHDEMDRLSSTRGDSCSKAEGLAKRLVTRLLVASDLNDAAKQLPNLDVGVACKVKGVKLAETKAGLIWLYPDFILGFTTEDQLAAILAHEIIHYMRSHEEDLESTLESWMPFRENALNRARWEHEKEADRLAVRLVAAAGFDPEAAREAPLLTDKIMTGSPDWKVGQINFPLDSAFERSMRIQFEIKDKKLRSIPQTIGEMPEAKAQLSGNR